jgi:hypothetical protein
VKEPNTYLKGRIVEKFGGSKSFVIALANGKGGVQIREDRLSRIIHRRVKPTAAEKRAICWKLQEPIDRLFPAE